MAGATIDNINIVATADVSKAVKEIEKLKDQLSGLKKTAVKAAPAVKETEKSVNKVGKTAKHAASGIEKMAAAIKRVIVYRMLRGAIKAITQAFAEGVQNAYMWAKANEDAFSQVMDTYATRTNYVKNTLGALSSTVLTALLPAFMQVTNWLVEAINLVNEFLAAITGQDSYLKAREVAIEYAEATDDAAKAQKKLNQQLMAFDELNVITTPKDSSKNGNDDAKWQDAFIRTQVTRFSNLRNIISQLTVPFEKIGEVFSQVSEFVKDFGEGFLQGFLDTLNVDDLKRNFESIFDCAKRIFEQLNKWGVPKALGIFVGGLTSLVTQLTIFGTSSALQHIENLLTMIDSLLHLDFATFGLTFVQDFAQVVKDIVTPICYVLDVLTNNKYSLVDRLNGTYKTTPTPGEGTFTGGGAGTSFGTPTSALTNKSGVGGGKKFITADYALFASGGYPNMGSVFVAGEIPGSAEMVGTINGRTGVASGEEITGISEAVYSTGGETNTLLRELISVAAAGGMGKPSAAFGRYCSQSLSLYKGVTG